VKFELLGQIEGIEVIAVGTVIRDLGYLEKTYGPGRWRKLKGSAPCQGPQWKWQVGLITLNEAHGIGRKEIKIKRYLG
jgi:hypothetical protein